MNKRPQNRRKPGTKPRPKAQGQKPGFWFHFAGFFLHNKALALIGLALVLFTGWFFAPFAWNHEGIERQPVAVDAIPDLGENQQVVYSAWPGRSPRDIEDQVTYPLTVALTGLPGVRTVRSMSMFGFSSIYVVFDDDIDFYWSRSRILEKLNALPAGTLPEGVNAQLGPDATSLGQIFWYTLEGRDESGAVTSGWSLEELRALQDWTIRYALLAVDGVSEVAGVGGFVREYQVELNPAAMKAYNINLKKVYDAIRAANRDVGARTMEINSVEYVVRGLGYFKSLADLEDSVVGMNGDVPVYLKNVGRVFFGPAPRRGILDRNGAEVVGGVVVVRYGENPLAIIERVKAKLAELAPTMPKKRLADGRLSQVNIVPFYDRTGLIKETLGTLNAALIQQILITIAVILLMIRHFRIASIISLLLPATVLLTFVLMKLFGVTANVVALGGIAIAIGTIVDIGIVVCENVVHNMREAKPNANMLRVIQKSIGEIGGAVVTAMATTVISFLPVFTLQYEAGKLFRPLAFTKTFTLSASLFLALTILPVFCYYCFGLKVTERHRRQLLWAVVAILPIAAWMSEAPVLLLALIPALFYLFKARLPKRLGAMGEFFIYVLVVLLVLKGLTLYWLPAGPLAGFWVNFLLVAGPVFGLLGLFFVFQIFYERILDWCLNHKALFLSLPTVVVLWGLIAVMGWPNFVGLINHHWALSWVLFSLTLMSWFMLSVKVNKLWRILPAILAIGLIGQLLVATNRGFTANWLPSGWQVKAESGQMTRWFPGMKSENRPKLDEGSFLYMPSIAYHGSVAEVKDYLSKENRQIARLPEVTQVVGKAGRADTPLDPAPLGMIETVINYHNEFISYEDGAYKRFKFDRHEVGWMRNAAGEKVVAPDGEPYQVQGRFVRDEAGQLIEDEEGVPFRLWRKALDPALNPGREAWPGIRHPDDIWDQIIAVSKIPGATVPDVLQPIETRLVMLQSGMRARMGVKIQGSNLEAIETAALQIEQWLKQVEGIRPEVVLAKRIQGKPYLEIVPDRQSLARYGIPMGRFLETVEVGIGGRKVTETVEGRERYAVTVRFERERRDNPEELMRLPVFNDAGQAIPLQQLAEIKFRSGPQNIQTEDGLYMTFVSFALAEGAAESEVVERADGFLKAQIAASEDWPAGTFYYFSGEYQKQQQTAKRLKMIIPVALVIIFLILYLQFRDFWVTGFVFKGIMVAWAGGFVMLWLYAQPWFLDFSIAGIHLRELFHVGPVNLNVAVWVGFLALFGIATDDGVVMASFIRQETEKRRFRTPEALRQAVISAGQRRVKACLMTTATTILALLPVLTSDGKGSDLMGPMAIPLIGGMLFEVMTMLVVPVMMGSYLEIKQKLAAKKQR